MANQKKQPRPLPQAFFRKTQAIIDQVQRDLKMPLITYWNSDDGSVCFRDANALYEVLQRIGAVDRCALFIKSEGGNGQAALKIVNLLRKYIKNIIALIPLECESAATMIALGADQIAMGPLANLTAVDTSIKHQLSPLSHTNDRVAVSLDELSRVVRLWKKQDLKHNAKNPYDALFQYVHPLVIGAIDRSESLSTKLCEEILSYHSDEKNKIRKISHRLNSEYPSHDYPITLREACAIGLNAAELDPKINESLLELNVYYSEMAEELRVDYDKHNYHTCAVLNVMEAIGVQVLFQTDKNWHYILEEKRWRSTNDESGWFVIDKVKNVVSKKRLYIN